MGFLFVFLLFCFFCFFLKRLKQAVKAHQHLPFPCLFAHDLVFEPLDFHRQLKVFLL